MIRAAHFLALAAVSALALSCEMQSYDNPKASAMDPPPKAINGVPIPDSQPIREANTRCEEVKDGSLLVGYAVVYEPLPAYDHTTKRRYPAGTVLVEDKTFAMIGVITPYGSATRFADSGNVEYGKGTIDEQLPKFFGKKSVTRAPIAK